MSIVSKLDPRHWRVVRRGYDYIRQQYFTFPGAPAQIRVGCDLETLRTKLGKRYFTNGWELSYSYEGEDLNMRRPEWVDDEYNWYQLHVRAFEDDGAVTVHVHLELEPTEYPSKHIEEINFSSDKGLDLLEDVLDDADIDYDLIDQNN